LRLWLAIGVALAAITAPWLLLHGRRREYVTTEHTERTEALPR
jgi:pimeloyl-ACP methyl ester carboxylesterase